MVTDILVLGSGVIGLTSAVVLAEGGHRVEVLTREPAAGTTSAVAGGLWWPYRIEPGEQAAAWSSAALRVMTELALDPAETGVRLTEGTEVGRAVSELGPWAAGVPGLRDATPGELPGGYDRAVRARVPLIDMPAHLSHLLRRLAAAGGKVTTTAVASLADAARHPAPVIVNCTGLGARELVPDRDTHPVRGQLVVVENPGVDEWFAVAGDDQEDTTYLFPQPYGLVLGGTAQEHSWDRAPSPATARAIVARCARVHPAVARARVLAHRVGLRPARRGGVRLAAERLPDGRRLVHNYGHGGAGVTVSWGCAQVVAELVSGAADIP